MAAWSVRARIFSPACSVSSCSAWRAVSRSVIFDWACPMVVWRSSSSRAASSTRALSLFGREGVGASGVSWKLGVGRVPVRVAWNFLSMAIISIPIWAVYKSVGVNGFAGSSPSPSVSRVKPSLLRCRPWRERAWFKLVIDFERFSPFVTSLVFRVSWSVLPGFWITSVKMRLWFSLVSVRRIWISFSGIVWGMMSFSSKVSISCETIIGPSVGPRIRMLFILWILKSLFFSL